MKKYLVNYHTPAPIYEKMNNAAPEERQKVMQTWMTWFQENKNNLVDTGAPLVNGKAMSNNSVSSSNKDLSGYFIIQAESVDEAVKILQNHPHLLYDDSCTLEIHETMQMPEM